MRAQGRARDRGKGLAVIRGAQRISAGERYNRHMVTTPAGEKYVPEKLTRIADGHKLPAVAAWLSEATGRAWHPRTVAAMIRNTTYRGEHRDGKGSDHLPVPGAGGPASCGAGRTRTWTAAVRPPGPAHRPGQPGRRC